MNSNTTNKPTRNGVLCDICSKRLRSRYHLKLHLAVHTGEKNYICGICKKGFQQKWNLVTHMTRVHSKLKPFKCTECEKEFGYSSHFKRHVKAHFLDKIQAPETVKKRILNPHKCEFCEKSFETNYRLDLHMRRHTGCKPFACEKCAKSFTTRRLIAVHMRKKHNVEFDFICEQCGEAFPNRHSILSHLRMGHKISDIIEDRSCQKHKSEGKSSNKGKGETISCEVCGKTVSRRSMKKHLNIHYRNRIYSCRFCKKEFLESGQRMIHERKHTGEKPYLCDVCGRGHSQYGNLLTHRKRYHNLVDKTPKLWKRATEKLTSKDISESTDSEITNDGNGTLREEGDKANPRNNMPSHIKHPSSEVSTIKPIYTGSETIEEFLTIAGDWISKKFLESKAKVSTVPEKDDFPFSNKSEANNEENEELQEEARLNGHFSNDDDIENSKDYSFLEIFKEMKNANKVNEISVKDVKRNINNLIFEKITQDLENTMSKNQVRKIVEKMKRSKEPGKMDALREFLKVAKIVPDNIVMKTDKGKVSWCCWICNSKFTSRHLLSRHLLIHEPAENHPYKCQFCQKTFTQSNNFKEHIMSHDNRNQFYCEKCGSGFRHKSHFNIHMKRHDHLVSPTKPKKHECSFCSKKFDTNFHKNEHQRTHTKEKPYLCKVCGHQFGALSTLNRHQRTHINAHHQCDICLKFFREKSSLKRHVNIHSGCERVVCECGKNFSQNASLKKHKMICENRKEPIDKPFSCIICEKKFLTKSDLKRHVGTHDSTKKFKCPLCSTKLKSEETLKRHIRRHEDQIVDVLSCELCTDKFNSIKTLRKHIWKSHLN